MRLLSWLFKSQTPDEKRALAVAGEHFVGAYANDRIVDSTVRAQDSNKLIIAIFFEPFGQIARPAPYRFIEVCRNTWATREIVDKDELKLYWYYGRK